MKVGMKPERIEMILAQVSHSTHPTREDQLIASISIAHLPYPIFRVQEAE
jgi:hypothetical protein